MKTRVVTEDVLKELQADHQMQLQELLKRTALMTPYTPADLKEDATRIVNQLNLIDELLHAYLKEVDDEHEFYDGDVEDARAPRIESEDASGVCNMYSCRSIGSDCEGHTQQEWDAAMKGQINDREEVEKEEASGTGYTDDNGDFHWNTSGAPAWSNPAVDTSSRAKATRPVPSTAADALADYNAGASTWAEYCETQHKLNNPYYIKYFGLGWKVQRTCDDTVVCSMDTAEEAERVMEELLGVADGQPPRLTEK